ncbi:hypothetical protein ACS0TY_019331 [Phlomoides rotata]
MWKLKIAEGSSPWLHSVNEHVGRQTWEFDPSLGSPEELAEIEKLREQFHVTRFEKKHSSDLLMRLQLSKENPATTDIPQVKVKDVEDITEEKVTNTLRRAISSHTTLQAKDGHWPGDYGGPMFLLPGLVITLSITGTLNAILTEEHRREIRRYLYNHQNRDGGWGLHIEGPSTMIGSVLTYVTLRLLGEGANDGDGSMEKGRDWILEHGGGGATAITSWGKDVALGLELTPYIAVYVLGAFEWSGNNPLPPEIWLLPYILPIHPGRMWCHCRMVYLPMSYLYGKRFVGPLTPTVLSLRKELFTVPYHEIDWNRARSECALVHTAAFNIQSLRSYSSRAFPEDLYYPHPFVQDILWTTLHKVVEPVLLRWPGKKLTEKSLWTVMEHIHYEDENTRYICIGPVNKVLNMLCCWAEDQNSEAFKLHIPRINNFLWLAEDGMKMQLINPAETFGDIVIDYPAWFVKGNGNRSTLILPKKTRPNQLTALCSYVECTSAAIQALTAFKKLYPGHRKEEVEHCIERSAKFIEKIQEADGSWYGSWAVCYTYGTWFGVRGLVAAGRSFSNSSAVRKSCDFLLSVVGERAIFHVKTRSINFASVVRFPYYMFTH